MMEDVAREPVASKEAASDQPASPVPRKITLLGLITATYLLVAGGPFGLEDIVHEAGYLGAVVALSVIPFIWSLPGALMVSELSSMLPEEGGYYVWVRRGLGPFWGFQEAWLSLTSSVFDMAIYPILFVTYLGFVGSYAAPGLSDWGAQAAGQGDYGHALGNRDDDDMYRGEFTPAAKHRSVIILDDSGYAFPFCDAERACRHLQSRSRRKYPAHQCEN